MKTIFICLGAVAGAVLLITFFAYLIMIGCEKLFMAIFFDDEDE